MHPVTAKEHPEARVQPGVLDPNVGPLAGAKGGVLVWLEDGVPKRWTDRPLKFDGAMHARVEWFRARGRERRFEDIKWQAHGRNAWWRLPEYPDGVAASPEVIEGLDSIPDAQGGDE